MFKKIMMIAAVGLLIMSCGGGGPKTKTLTPASTMFTSGELAKYVEVVDQPSELMFIEKDGVIPSQIFQLKVKLEMVKDGLSNVDAIDIDFTGLLSVAIINLVDENGVEVQDINIKDEDLLKLKKLLCGKKGDTEEIIFEGEFYNSDDSSKWFEQSAQFTPYLTGNIVTPGMTESLGAMEEVVENIDIETEEEAEEETSTTSTASNDFDEVLDSYEEYVDQYVSYMKKAANGDMSALTEYPALMEKAQEVSKKLEDSKDEMSAAQASRYMQITNKMTAAATQMQ